VGAIFPERNVSFDFINVLDEFKVSYSYAKGINVAPTKSNQPQADLSLKSGETFALNINGIPASNTQV